MVIWRLPLCSHRFDSIVTAGVDARITVRNETCQAVLLALIERTD